MFYMRFDSQMNALREGQIDKENKWQNGFGDLLLEENLITEDQIKRALEDQQKSGEPLWRIL